MAHQTIPQAMFAISDHQKSHRQVPAWMRRKAGQVWVAAMLPKSDLAFPFMSDVRCQRLG